jgi:hypothetical protein
MNKTPSKRRQSEADLGQTCVFLFPQNRPFRCSANLSNVFPKKNTAAGPEID